MVFPNVHIKDSEWLFSIPSQKLISTFSKLTYANEYMDSLQV